MRCRIGSPKTYNPLSTERKAESEDRGEGKFAVVGAADALSGMVLAREINKAIGNFGKARALGNSLGGSQEV